MPRPKKRSTIAKRLYAQRCATEASQAEVQPLPLKKMATAEVRPLPLKKMAEAAQLPLKISQAEAAQLPLKISRAEVSPLPRKTKVDLPVTSGKCHRANQQVPLRPVSKRVEAAPLPLKISQAEVVPNPLKKLVDNERLCSLSKHTNTKNENQTNKFPENSKSFPYVSQESFKNSQKSLKNSQQSLKNSKQSLKNSQQFLKCSRESAERFVVRKKFNENVLSTLPACYDFFPQKSLLKGSFHQGDARFGESRGRQCGAISLTAVLMSKMKNVLTWTTQDLNGVLVAGTRLYESLRNQGNINDQEVMGRHYIAVHELPRRHVLGNTVFSIEYAESLTGFVNVDDYDESLSNVAMPVDVALQRALLSAESFLLCICANTCAVIKEGSWYAFVDSHANMTETSCVAYHSTIESLYNYINEIAHSFGVIAPRFEITGVSVHADAEVSHSLEADHSSFPCSSGKELYSEVLKRKPKVCKSVPTEVRSSVFQLPEVEVQNAGTNVPMPQPVCNVLPSKGERGRRKNQDEPLKKWAIKTHSLEADHSSCPQVSGKALYSEVLKRTPKCVMCCQVKEKEGEEKIRMNP
ncbi:uncharacterized protein LOC120473990 isoform X2 [Pimephales promelas]|uniref:uncharacterized protein LOC120473990 isoform X2 n=1 Tax=Pimephales promelas TaxID=90988 RepID=UPI001955EF16|nr:uncharacterized protein LOC120473990 isoform X2 [Pimephales promelas]